MPHGFNFVINKVRHVPMAFPANIDIMRQYFKILVVFATAFGVNDEWVSRVAAAHCLPSEKTKQEINEFFGYGFRLAN